MGKGDPCPFGVCLEGEGRNTAISALCTSMVDVEKGLDAVARRVRVLQFIVVGGVIVDFLVNSRVVQVAVSFIGR